MTGGKGLNHLCLALLQALNIETEEDIHLLASYFMHLRGKPDPGEEEKVSNIQ